MSINDINNAAAAMNALKERYEGFLNDADAQIAQRQGQYDALANDLKGVIRSEAAFEATVDPDVENPVGGDGGTYNSLRGLIDGSPKGSLVFANLAAGKTHYLDANIGLAGRKLFIRKAGVGDRPVLTPNVAVTAGSNECKRFTDLNGGLISISDVDVTMPPKVDEALGWHAFYYCLVENYLSPSVDMRLNLSKFTTDTGGTLVSANRGTIVNMSLHDATIDGPGFAVKQVGGWGVALIAKRAVTLLNGASLQQGGTIGVDVLENGGT